jgi:hypothetical protein
MAKAIYVKMQFPTMRKQEEFTIYPCKPFDQIIKIQSDRRIAMVDLDVGEIFLSIGRTNGSYIVDLSHARGARRHKLTDEQILALRRARDMMAGKTNIDGTFQLTGGDK